jgi:hypothetical protein
MAGGLKGIRAEKLASLKKQSYVKALTYRQDCFFAMAERCP